LSITVGTLRFFLCAGALLLGLLSLLLRNLFLRDCLLSTPDRRKRKRSDYRKDNRCD
jgi:hypothetical protein